MRLLLAGSLALLAAPAGGQSAGASPPGDLPACEPAMTAAGVAATAAGELETLLDERGWLAGYRLAVGTDGVVELGARGFASGAQDGRIVVGEREGTGTSLALLDLARGCRVWQRDLDMLAYSVSLSPAAEVTWLAIDPVTRTALGDFRMTADGHITAVGEVDEAAGGACAEDCLPEDGSVTPAALLPLVSPRPVPETADDRWVVDTALRYRWHSYDPPSWARPAINDAAEDASTTRRSQAPTFRLDSDATDTIRYGSSMPPGCEQGIACATHNVPDWWTIRLRPHGTDFSWGTLRWCQADSRDGCFDIERTMLHEFGHIAGLSHPEVGGFRLRPYDTVMHQLIPDRPEPGSGMRAYAHCDTATLQKRYDVQRSTSLISTCLDLVTRLSLEASAYSIRRGASVLLTARLNIVDRDGYGRLGGNLLSEREVLLRYRPAGSSQSWMTAWMSPGSTSGSYVTTLIPQGTWEYQAVFRSPSDEGLQGDTSGLVTVKVS